ncbi:enoyl-CoA hydratase-related protein [Pontivivens ytuae]|uniref:Enoyl-CoA hydratase/isomerase family protein n=1 Tax=Pontivivens ytuae TaxID=2789856 RepID=A0A7S9QC76_9RHOB|nr:enoyl-CoA hydratase-related protein [Pontivivens ytuae]QPH53633.1 enoyl-CoA hydratase/isomerase family protein [Pontivivens ytuae]
MNYETILYEVKDDVATLTLNRPDVMNGLNAQMRADILHAVRHAPEDARVLVITGAGRGFCSGQDLGDRKNAAQVNLERTLRDEYEPMLKAIYDSPIPTISAVNGPAAGAGANIALAADVVIAAESAFFLQAFARIGLIPDAGGTYWLPRQMGFAKAMGAALFADKITAREADEWGMIWAAVPDAEFEAEIARRARQLAEGPTQAYARIKQALRGTYDNTLDDQLNLEAKLQGEAGQTRDFTEGVMAFLEKRPARYEGR